MPQLRILNYIAKLLLLINLFCVIYLIAPNTFKLRPAFSTMAACLVVILMVVFAGGRYWERTALGVQSLLFALGNLAFLLFILFRDGRIVICLALGILSLAFACVGGLLLTSKSRRDEHL